MTTTTPGPLGGRTGDLRSQALALMFITGSCLALLAVVLPGADEVHELRWAINGGLALPVGAAIWVVGDRLPAAVIHLILVVGAAVVALGITFGEGGSFSVAATFFFIWVALYTFIFFRWQVAVAHLALDTALLVLALVVAGVDGVAGVALMITGTAAVVGAVAGRARWELDRLARTDPLTGLHNRRALQEALDTETARAARTGLPFSVVLIDLDDFKGVNDRLGHQAGDDLLVRAAQFWQESLRSIDVLARYGGDEFIAILPGCFEPEATAVSQRLQHSCPHACSLGVATWEAGDTPADLLERADGNLYSEKERRSESPSGK